LLVAVLSLPETSVAEGPRLGTVIDVQPEALVIQFDVLPDATLNNDPASRGDAETERIPLSGQAGRVTWQPGMPVRVWPNTTARSGPRIQPIGATGGFDRTGVRRRLSKGSQRGGRGSPGGGHSGRGGR
jgi:hypothetical protein